MDPRGVLRISSDGDDRMGAKVQDPKKSLDQKLTPKKPQAKFLTLKILNIKTVEIESGSYCNNTRDTQKHFLWLYLIAELHNQGQENPKIS